MPDIAGRFQVRVRATSASGTFADAIHTFDVSATAPTIVVATSLSPSTTSSTLAAAVGNLVTLDAGASWVPSGNAQGTWSLRDKPFFSNLTQLTTTSPTAVAFVPDAPGRYTVQYALVDATTGGSSLHQVQVNVAYGPTADVRAHAAPVPQASGPSYVAAIGSAVTLRGGGSHDPNGEALTYSWVLVTRPAGSAAALAGATTASPVFTPDVDGSYGVLLTVTNTSGLSAVQTVSVFVGSHPPVAIVDRAKATVLLGSSVTASAADSYSRTGAPLSFRWALDARPAGSNAAIAAPGTASLSFTPDVAGSYYASVTVTDGTVSTVSGVSVLVLTPSTGTVPLGYQPRIIRYSKALNRLVVASSSPNELHVVDVSAGTDVSIALPAAAKAMSVSANGRLAGVLHEGTVSLVDLGTATVLRTSATIGTQSDVFTANSGMLFVAGLPNGDFSSARMSGLDGLTGVFQGHGGSWNIRGVTYGVMSESLGRVYTLSEGMSPADVAWTDVSPAAGTFTGASGDSPYHGTYGMSNPLWLSGDDSLLFTASGTYFRSADLVYVGTLGSRAVSISHSATAAEALMLASDGTWSTTRYPEVLKRFTGPLLLPAADVRLPLVGGEQTYGLAVFHAADDRKVIVVQTGGSAVSGAGLQYLVLLR